ncbi:MAG: FecR domain-containing protein, partial [Candidatus Aminicenantes bacterium]|nr:FecR domain-containing protein [Candidatus Aminicenantes bacterium]
MKTKATWGILCFGLLAAFSAAAAAQDSIYLGHISMADIRNDGKDVLVFREGAVAGEPALLNMPLGPGDAVRTSDIRRTEIQFDNGTILRLDYDTELKIETILAPSLSSLENISNVVLTGGRAYIMFTEYDRRELFQVLTPGAAIKMKNHTVAEVAAAADGSTAVRVSKGRVDVLFGPSPKKTDGEKVRSGESLVVTADGRLERTAAPAATEFEAWNEGLNETFVQTHDGLTPLPKPVQKMTKAVFYFAQRYSTAYGEWLWDDFLGYVWRPNDNDRRYPWGSWAPYYAGQWARRDGQMFWVPQEPWGWVPFHLGVWHWDKTKGWLWIPGSAFAPAWVAWRFYGDRLSWRPWLLWDWYFADLGMAGWWNDLGFWNMWYGWTSWYGMGCGYYPWGYYYYYPGYGSGEPGPSSGRTILTWIAKEQLKGKKPSIVPVPKDLRTAYGRLAAAVKKGDPRVVG